MARPLRKKGFPLFDDIAELVDGTRATGEISFRAGLSTTPSIQDIAASAPISYEPVIDPELLNLSLDKNGISGEGMDRNVPLVASIHRSTSTLTLLTTVQDNKDPSTSMAPKRSFFDREIESFISTVSNFTTVTRIQMS